MEYIPKYYTYLKKEQEATRWKSFQKRKKTTTFRSNIMYD